MSQIDNANISFDDLLDGTLDDLNDMPEFKPFAAGAYKVKLNFEQKTINELPCVELKLTVIELAELTNPEDKPAVAGDNTNVLFMMKKKDDSGKIVRNDLAEGQFKELLKSLAPAFPEAKSNRDIITAAENFEVLAVVSVRPNKKDKTHPGYTSLDSVVVL